MVIEAASWLTLQGIQEWGGGRPVEEAGWKGEGGDCRNRDTGDKGLTREREGLHDTVDDDWK